MSAAQKIRREFCLDLLAQPPAESLGLPFSGLTGGLENRPAIRGEHDAPESDPPLTGAGIAADRCFAGTVEHGEEGTLGGKPYRDQPYRVAQKHAAAGFTPELVCVVYVGFDNGDDLGMKGSDSALPIWADFMQEALKLHPEWNGDWAMPANLRKAEIDIRNGALIRETDDGSDLLVPSIARSSKGNER